MISIVSALQTNEYQSITKGIWGTFKPNLYFAVKEQTDLHNVLGLAWMVKDWWTDAMIVRHAYQFAQPYENVDAYFTAHDGKEFARETIVDSEYNTRILVDFI